MEIHLLGPVRLTGAEGVAIPAGRRQQVVLSMLALNAQRLTPMELLVDAVWDGTPPDSAHSQIQICVSGLRKLMRRIRCATRISTRSPGYLLDGADLDCQRFTRLVEQARGQERVGRFAEAVSSLRSALELWRGPALEGMTGAVVGRAAARLDESRIAAEIDVLRLELRLGRHAEILADLRAITGRYPLHEELYGYLMLALLRCGRPVEALEVFQRASTILTKQVGIEPGEHLRNLRKVITTRMAEGRFETKEPRHGRG